MGFSRAFLVERRNDFSDEKEEKEEKNPEILCSFCERKKKIYKYMLINSLRQRKSFKKN